MAIEHEMQAGSKGAVTAKATARRGENRNHLPPRVEEQLLMEGAAISPKKKKKKGGTKVLQ